MKVQKTPLALASAALFATIPHAAQAAPTVSFKAPAAGTTISQPINQTAACEVTGLRIQRVVFSIRPSSGGTWTTLNTEQTGPWQCNVDPTKFATGQYTLRAVAWDADSGGSSATATRTINISNGGSTGGGTTNTAPTVSITAPSGTVSGTSVGCAANATDGNGVAQVQFFLDSATTAFATELSAPYTCSIDSTKLSNGSHTLKAIATDTLGASRTTQASFTVSNTTSGGGNAAPSVSFTTPSSGKVIASGGGLPSCEATATDANGIQKVDFYMNDKLYMTELSKPYNCNFSAGKFPNGAYTLKAVATDKLGATGSAQISLTIGSATQPPANVSPNVSIMKPDAGATITAPLNSTGCVADASDTDGTISKVDFFLTKSGTSTPVGSKTAAPYQCAIDTAKFADGSYTLMAQATDDKGAVSSAQRSLTISKSTGDGGGGSTSPVSASDIITRVSADVPFAQQNGYTAQVINTYTSASNIPESGIHGTTLSSGETLRLGKVTDPANSVRKALAFQVAKSDPLTSKGKRSELSVTPNIEMNKTYWIAYNVFVHDWGNLASGDDALFGVQMHSGDNQAGVGGPSFGIYTTPNQGGRQLRVHARYNLQVNPTGSTNTVKINYPSYPIPFERWTNFVVKFRHNLNGNGFVQVWMDGQLIANHQGNLGFDTGHKDYAKFGYYNWATSMGSTERKVLLRSPTIVLDPTGSTYTLEQLRALVSASSDTTASSSVLDLGSTTTASAGGGGVCSTIDCAAQ